MCIGAGAHDGGVQRGQLGRVEDLAPLRVHVGADQPRLEHSDQRGPVVGRCADEDAVEVGGIPLGERERLAAAVRDAVEVRVRGRAAVVRADDRLRGEREIVLGPVAEDDPQHGILLGPQRAGSVMPLVVGGDDELSGAERSERRLVPARARGIGEADVVVPAEPAAALLQVAALPRGFGQQDGEVRLRADVALHLAERDTVRRAGRGRLHLRADRAQVDRCQRRARPHGRGDLRRGCPRRDRACDEDAQRQRQRDTAPAAERTPHHGRGAILELALRSKHG